MAVVQIYTDLESHRLIAVKTQVFYIQVGRVI